MLQLFWQSHKSKLNHYGIFLCGKNELFLNINFVNNSKVSSYWLMSVNTKLPMLNKDGKENLGMQYVRFICK